MYVDTGDTKIKACNALNAMYANTVDTGVCGFYTTLYTVYCTLYAGPLAPPRGKATVLPSVLGV